MSWDAAGKGPILNARQRWQAQEHDRRVRLLGEWLADEWDSVVDEFTDANGKVHKEKVLQLMECTFEMGRHAADKRTSGPSADGREPAPEIRSPDHELARRAADDARGQVGLGDVRS